jgi:serine protease Do
MPKSQFTRRLKPAMIAFFLIAGLGEYGATARWPEAAVSVQESPDVSFEQGFAPVVKRIRPAVVNIASSRMVRTATEESPLFLDPFLNEFFGEQFQIPRERREHSLGSGVIVSNAGYVMTNSHVVERATEIRISLLDKREFDARIVGTDPKTDIALLKIEANNLTPIPLGDSAEVEVGEFVLAVGNPFSVGQSVTLGIVSATGRGGLGIETYEDFIQTDAAINPGNSGGAMVNVHGQLIGINTAIVSGGAQGVGFAVPINLAQQVMYQILKHGRVVRGWLGAQAQTPTPPVMQAFGLTGQPRGALVTDVIAGSPAARNGLLKGDIILEINGQPLEDSRSLSLKISMTPPGTLVRMKVFRDGRELELTATLTELQEKAVAAEPPRPDTTGPRFGLTVEPLTSRILRELGLPPDTQGVIISDVEPGSAAEEAGLRFGDIIQEVNRRRITSVKEFRNAMQDADTMVMLLVNRQGDHAFVALEGPREPAR